MNGGIPPLQDRRLAAGFVVFMYASVAALVTILLTAALTRSDILLGIALGAGAILGAAFGAWRIHSTPEDER
ncbi:hypothetical protein [Streptomyces sp. CBMA29]|uniref:hypothetical protein n=1 Tax=Streptomyces sp. CBMA29 TaxID=1896314 RepID=UPI001CB75B07|nr:hypothetical protein [Streptomyces sp. CBMA29]MBD0738695.1 hypothetical protein [Streptomyces sp. CBMA29]